MLKDEAKKVLVYPTNCWQTKPFLFFHQKTHNKLYTSSTVFILHTRQTCDTRTKKHHTKEFFSTTDEATISQSMSTIRKFKCHTSNYHSINKQTWLLRYHLISCSFFFFFNYFFFLIFKVFVFFYFYFF